MPRVRTAPANGYVLWEGRSWNGKPIAVVATGLLTASSNPKTGPMVQVYALHAEVPPHVAVTTGDDAAVCNDCPLRQYTVGKAIRRLGLKPTRKPTMCYVTTSNGVRAVFDGYKRGIYPKAGRSQLATIFAGRKVRLGAYGNFSNVPFALVEEVVRACTGWTLYEHCWKDCDQRMARYAMASVSSVEEKAQANAMGWRTFRVKQEGDPALPDEVVCPASDEAGYKTDCYTCLLCQGTSKRARNVVVNDHGPTSTVLARRRRHDRRMALPVLKERPSGKTCRRCGQGRDYCYCK